MFHIILILFLNINIFTKISCENINGVYVIDTCECNSSNEKCEPNGPFIFEQQRSNLAVRYGTVQVGVGTLGNNRLDLYLNQNRCKGLWNRKTHIAELKCQHQNDIICTTKLRCVSGICLDDTSINISSTSNMINYSLIFIINSLLILIY